MSLGRFSMLHTGPARTRRRSRATSTRSWPSSDPNSKELYMKNLIACALTLAAALVGPAAQAQPAKPTIVLVHGAFADSSSWNGVITILERDGYPVVAAPNP